VWMMTTTGFYSVVNAGRGNVQVRARSRDDLVALRRRFGLAQRIKETPHADYPYRVVIPLRTWTACARKLAADVARYKNFKDAVKATDPYRADVYLRVWYVIRDGMENWSETCSCGHEKDDHDRGVCELCECERFEKVYQWRR